MFPIRTVCCVILLTASTAFALPAVPPLPAAFARPGADSTGGSDGTSYAVTAFETLVQTPSEPATGSGGGSPPAGAADTGYDNGNDPSKIRKRMTFRSDYARFANGLGVNTVTLQAAFPILQEETLKANFGFDLPLNYYDVKRPIRDVLAGVGDMKAQVVFVKPATERVTLVFGTNLWMPTAEQQLLRLPAVNQFTSVDLGTGKFRLEPLFGAVFFVNKDLFVIPFYAHDLSFAGKPDAGTINRGTARLFVNYSLSEGYYVSSESQFLINFANGNDLDAFQRLELGKAFKNGTVVYVKPGVGIAPGPFNREWGVEAGLRFVF